MSKQDFLLEIGLEEMPARFVTDAMNQLKKNVSDWLRDYHLQFDDIEAFSTPRRLAILVHGLVEKQADMEEEARGPAKKIAKDADGKWTKAAEGFARGQGVATDDLFFREVKGQEYVFAKKQILGKETKTLLADIKEVITSLHFPKNMRWNKYDLKFVRPIQWLIALYGKERIPFEITGVATNKMTYGHRFLGSLEEITQPKDYPTILEQAKVIVRPEERKERIRQQIQQLEKEKDWIIPIDEGLLEEVTNLVEFPTALYGSFEESFLEVPEQVLITSMREHQRYFPVQNKKGELLPHFVTIRNGDQQHLENVVKGNEKVLRARLSDAQFFYREDQKLKLEDALSRLEQIVYHEELGTVGDKVRRIQEIAANLAELLNSTEKEHISRTATLCKFDLVTQMVYEFPELQGHMGEDYALKAGEDPVVARAINEHYQPRFSGDSSPTTMVGTIVSIADKIDTITTCFAIGLIPTGSQDPYALRRQSAGIIQMILDHHLEMEIEELVTLSLKIAEQNKLLKRNKEEVFKEIVDFFKLRTKNTLQESGIRYDIIDAVLANQLGKISVTVAKANFLMDKVNQPEFKQVVEALSRVTNISTKAKGENFTINESLFEKEAERTLHATSLEANKRVVSALKQGEVEKAYQALAKMKDAINDYFEQIMVMTDNEEVKNNRLSQMKQLAETIEQFAKFQSIVFS